MKSLFLFILFMTSTLVFSQETNIKTIHWENPQGLEFRIYLFQNDLLIKEYISNDDFLNLELPPGEYTYRLNIMNKFGRIMPVSDDIPLVVPLSLRPVLLNSKSLTIYQKHEVPEVELETRDFQKEGRIYLILDEEEVPVSYHEVSERRYVLQWLQDENIPGDYTLILENPDGNKSSYEHFYRILPSLSPTIANVEPKELDISEPYSEVILYGKNFSNEMSYRLYKTGDQEIPLRFVRVDSENEVHLWLILDKEMLGNCDLVIETPWGDVFEYKRIIHINDRYARRNYYKNRSWGSDLLIGFPGQTLEAPYNRISSFEVQWRTDFAIDSILLRQSGMILNLDYYREDPYSLLGFGGGIYYRTRFFMPVNFVVSGLFGIKLDENWKNGPYLQAQAGIICLFNRILLEPYVEMQQWYGTTRNQNYYTAGIRAGYRF